MAQPRSILGLTAGPYCWQLLFLPSISKALRNRTLIRRFHGYSARNQSEGAYAGLAAVRVRIPFVEALRRQNEHRSDPTSVNGSLSRPPERDLRPRKMSESYHRLILPLKQDPFLLDDYITAQGRLRLGTLMLDLDALAGVIAYKHTGDSVMTVTAAVDRISIRHPLNEILDLELSGKVTFATGRSSMEVSIQVAKATAEGAKIRDEDVFMTCAFTMVSLDPKTKKPVNVAPLQIDTPEERQAFELGQRKYAEKKESSKLALRETKPNDEESELIHSIWRTDVEYQDKNSTKSKPPDVAYMDSTRLYSAQIMQPQYRNRHNFMIFGGFLLKSTFELAFSCAASFSHSRPAFLSLDPSTFQNPVPVGSVLYLTATVAYTDEPPAEFASALDGPDETSQTDLSSNSNGKPEGQSPKVRRKKTRVQVRVDSKVRDVEHEQTKPTGQFNYTFLVDKDISVMPRTYSEFMVWIDARRRVQRVDRDSKASTSGPSAFATLS